MRKVYQAYPADHDVATLYVEAMMNLTPWQLWDPHSGEPIENAKTLECRQVLERALAEVATAGPARHPGLLHLWMMPSRHALGALLLEQGHVDEATEIYEADLGLNDSVLRSNQHPDNVWALIGLYECYQRQGKKRDARMLKPRRDFATSRADKTIGASCFCSTRKQTEKGSEMAESA